MNNTREKISKIDTRNLLRHATARSSTKTVAALLGVAATRISEGKKGEWQLSGDYAAKLRMEFGNPLAEAGLFLECEVWDTVEKLKIESEKVAEWRHWLRVVAAIQHPAMQYILASLVSPEGTAGRERICDALGSLLQDDEFISWYQNCKMTLIDVEAGSTGWQGKFSLLSLSSSILSQGELNITEILNRNNFMPALDWHVEQLMKHRLTLILLGELACNRLKLGELAHSSQESFQPFISAWPEVDKPEEALTQEIVVTGDIIWRELAWISPSKLHSDVLSLTALPDMTAFLSSGDYEMRWLTGILPDQFNHMDLQVAMTKHLNYHLVLTLSLQRAVGSSCHMEEQRLISANLDDDMFVEWIPVRQIVIREVKSERLIDEIGKIHSWLGLMPPETYSLKREIARNGGYLAGVMYLE